MKTNLLVAAAAIVVIAGLVFQQFGLSGLISAQQ